MLVASSSWHTLWWCSLPIDGPHWALKLFTWRVMKCCSDGWLLLPAPAMQAGAALPAAAKEGRWEQSTWGCPTLPPCFSTRTLAPEAEHHLWVLGLEMTGAGGHEPRCQGACGDTTLHLQEGWSTGCCRKENTRVNLLLCSKQKRATENQSLKLKISRLGCK